MSHPARIILVLLIGCLASGWFAWLHHQSQGRPPAQTSLVDYIFYHVHLISYDKRTGLVAMRLQTPQMQRNRLDGTGTLIAPVFFLPDRQRHEWTLRAKTGWLSADGQWLRLTQEVQGDSPSASTQDPTHFQTDYLDVYPDQNLLKTSAKIMFDRPGLRQTGVGFQADLNAQQYLLLSNVNAHYVPDASH